MELIKNSAYPIVTSNNLEMSHESAIHAGYVLDNGDFETDDIPNVVQSKSGYQHSIEVDAISNKSVVTTLTLAAKQKSKLIKRFLLKILLFIVHRMQRTSINYSYILKVLGEHKKILKMEQQSEIVESNYSM